ncbi:MAG: rhomboid family intramembrane serine protease [Terriglobales bacterium]|jgi:membrane associated rhomboid family serine protease
MRSQSSSMIVTQAIFGINVAVFVAMTLAGVSLTSPTEAELVHWGANFGPQTIGGEWWRLLTCVFVHIGIIHIAFNMWCLWGLGKLAESVYGHWTFGAVYLITGIAASVTSLAWNPGGTSAGASGAIFGIAGALIASSYLGSFTMPAAAVPGMLRSVLMFVGYNLVFGMMSGHTDNAAHVGGLVSGLILGALIAKVAPQSDDLGRRLSVLLVVAVLVYGGAAWLHQSHAYLFHAASGQKLLTENHADQAIEELKTAVRQRPGYLPAHYELARGYWIKGDFANAESEFKRVIAINPKDERAYFYLGMAYLEQKEAQPARDDFSQLLKVNAKSADAQFGLAEVSTLERKYPEALEEYQRTLQLDPDYDGVYQEMGLVQGRLGLYDDAIASFLKQQKAGDNSDNEKALARAYEAKGMHREAAQAGERAKQFQEKQPSQ